MNTAADAVSRNSEATVVARFPGGPEAAARDLARQLAELFDPADAAVSTHETSAGWMIAIHFVDPPNETAVKALVALTAGPDIAQVLTFERLSGRDWVKESLAGLTPVEAGRFVVYGPHDRARVRVNRIGIEIAASMAFGTGHHGTTRGCLLMLDLLLKAQRPRRVLDIGTGSGVLAIAAAVALRCPVLASDIDPKAVQIARENIGINHAGRVTVVHAAGLGPRIFRAHGPFDLVLANILLEPLRRLSKPITRLVAPGARVVLSGLLATQANAALAAYRTQGLVLERRLVLDGWATLVLRSPDLSSPQPGV